MNTIDKKVTNGLAQLLADTYILYVKTQNFHWNVTGELFYTHHKMFEEQYQALASATDIIAERIRSLQAPAPATLKEFLELGTLKEAANNLTATAMIKELLNNHEQMSKNLTQLFSVAQEGEDEVTLDLFIQRKEEHDKTSWMLRSILEVN